MKPVRETPRLPTGIPAPESLWTALHCSRCKYVREHPGRPSAADLDGSCALCGAGLRAVTVFRVGAVSETVGSDAPQ